MTTLTFQQYFLQLTSMEEATRFLHAVHRVAITPALSEWRRVADLPDAVKDPHECAKYIGPYLVLSHRDFPNTHLISPTV